MFDICVVPFLQLLLLCDWQQPHEDGFTLPNVTQLWPQVYTSQVVYRHS